MADAIEKALRASSAFDFQTEAIDAAVARQLPAALEEALPSLLHEIMPTLFAGSPSHSNCSTSHNSFDRSHLSRSRSSPSRPPRSTLASPTKPKHSSSSSTVPPPREQFPKLPTLARISLPHLAMHLDRQFRIHQRRLLTSFTAHLDTETGLLAHESALLIDDLEEVKTDLLLLREDVISELTKEISSVLERGREEGVELADEVAQILSRVWGEACENVDRVGKWEVKKMVRREVALWHSAGVSKEI